jgi:uncharacterized membrane protein YoaK (UPF0700 family)
VSRRAVPAIAVLLAACAGATDALAFFGLGKAFAGIVTSNLVTAGHGHYHGAHGRRSALFRTRTAITLRNALLGHPCGCAPALA